MTGFSKIIFAGMLLAAVAAAAPAIVFAADVSDQEGTVSGNDVFLPDIEDSGQDESISLEDSSTVSGNGISGSDDPDSGGQPVEDDSSFSSSEFSELLSLLSDDIELRSSYNSYYGSISSTYVEYFRGYLSRLGFYDHYVCSRVSQYDYIFAYGDLTFSGGIFSGSDIMVVTFSTRDNGTFSSGLQSSFSLNPHSYLVYTDIDSPYPSLATSADMSLRQVVFFIGILVTFYTLTQFLRTGVVRSRSRRR